MVEKVDVTNKHTTVNTCKHTDSRKNGLWMLLLKVMPLEYYYWKLKKLQEYDVIILYFHPLWFSRQEWAVAPSIFNIKHRGWLVAFFR